MHSQKKVVQKKGLAEKLPNDKKGDNNTGIELEFEGSKIKAFQKNIQSVKLELKGLLKVKLMWLRSEISYQE